MFHSLPALAISGLAVFLVYHNDNLRERYYLTASVMVGFLSHLLLDELYAVNFNGVSISLNQFAGSAVKLYSSSFKATAATYIILATLGYFAYEQFREQRDSPPLMASEKGTYRQVIRPGK
jgi:hypothetical protein